MFPARYFGDRPFAPRYFAKTGAEPTTAPPGGRVAKCHVYVPGAARVKVFTPGAAKTVVYN